MYAIKEFLPYIKTWYRENNEKVPWNYFQNKTKGFNFLLRIWYAVPHKKWCSFDDVPDERDSKIGILSSQNVTQIVYGFVPIQNFTGESDIDWNQDVNSINKLLFEKYGLTEDERTYISNKIKPMWNRWMRFLIPVNNPNDYPHKPKRLLFNKTKKTHRRLKIKRFWAFRWGAFIIKKVKNGFFMRKKG